MPWELDQFLQSPGAMISVHGIGLSVLHSQGMPCIETAAQSIKKSHGKSHHLLSQKSSFADHYPEKITEHQTLTRLIHLPKAFM